MISAETIHIDASLIRANVSMDGLVSSHLDAVEAAHEDANGAERDARTSGKFKKICRTDPDATMATSSKAPLRPAYNQHTAVDDLAGVVVDVEIVTGEEHDTGRFDERLDAIAETLGVTPGRITADTSYGVGRVYAALEDRRIEAVIPPLRSPRRQGAQGFPTERFKFDPHHDVVRCPAKKRLTARNSTKSGRWYRANRRDCARCLLKAQCLPQGTPSRRVHIVTNHAAILRARRNARHAASLGLSKTSVGTYLHRARQAGLKPPGIEEKDKPKRRPIPDHIPRMEVELTPGAVACADCGGRLRRIGEDVTEELEYVPGRFIVNRIVRPRLTCSCCEKFVQSPLPSRKTKASEGGHNQVLTNQTQPVAAKENYSAHQLLQQLVSAPRPWLVIPCPAPARS